MRAIIINPEDQTVTERDIEGDFVSLQTLVDGYIELVRIVDYSNDIYVNEEGLLHEKIYRDKGFFLWSSYPNPLAGVGVVLGHTRDGESAPTKLTIDFIKANIKFCRLAGTIDNHWVLEELPTKE